ncbi:hypothetical protein B9Z19DRAFT_1128219 [Tuber borchii]|uniref:Uncharacterized protein n=1 Tax=Tuber borchii TaxID=42251 RepID=A0A2T6ZPT1_TUBBO|nr:hypothetical protein B9Z19DRAFT_1128219 [Tuber borchii]
MSVSPETTTKLWEHAIKLRTERKADLGGWVSFVIPEDLIVAPVQVDAVTVVFLYIATGMKFSVAVHPVLGALFHYTPSILALANESLEEIRMLSRAVNQGKGMWVNRVFGKVNDRGVGRGLLDFTMFLIAMEGFLLSHGWPEGSRVDSISGAAGFMAVATVDVYVAISPTCIHAWRAHFVEVIVEGHLYEIQGTEPVINPPVFRHVKGNIIDSRCLITAPRLGSAPLYQPNAETLNTLIERLQPFNFVNHGLFR